uniref:Uncharacterized protein LOC110202219 n=1 Tax=Phascolarctos cinereus TaxID=38626 RepID=A0A6P5JKQ5_PHACI|nr:uncharacterized protein LOC110202219 [Phascolarctos cinereus]
MTRAPALHQVSGQTPTASSSTSHPPPHTLNTAPDTRVPHGPQSNITTAPGPIEAGPSADRSPDPFRPQRLCGGKEAEEEELGRRSSFLADPVPGFTTSHHVLVPGIPDIPRGRATSTPAAAATRAAPSSSSSSSFYSGMSWGTPCPGTEAYRVGTFHPSTPYVTGPCPRPLLHSHHLLSLTDRWRYVIFPLRTTLSVSQKYWTGGKESEYSFGYGGVEKSGAPPFDEVQSL